MQVSKAALRRIIREAVKARLEENGEQSDVGMGAAEALTDTLIVMTREHDVSSDAFEVWMAREEKPMLPARIEDVGAFAEKLADHVLGEPELREALVACLTQILRSAMESVDDDRPDVFGQDEDDDPERQR